MFRSDLGGSLDSFGLKGQALSSIVTVVVLMGRMIDDL
jgi:hypothetical protein